MWHKDVICAQRCLYKEMNNETYKGVVYWSGNPLIGAVRPVGQTNPNCSALFDIRLVCERKGDITYRKPPIGQLSRRFWLWYSPGQRWEREAIQKNDGYSPNPNLAFALRIRNLIAFTVDTFRSLSVGIYKIKHGMSLRLRELRMSQFNVGGIH